MLAHRIAFWRETLWGLGAKILIPGWATVQFLAFIRDEWFTEYQDTYHLINLIPTWPWWGWVVAWLAILLAITLEGSYRIAEQRDQEIRRLEKQLVDLTKPVLTILHNPQQDIGPLEVADSGPARTQFTQCRIRVLNDTAVAIDGVEVYCEDARVLDNSPEYLLLFGGGRYPQELCPGEPLPVGIIREIVEYDQDRVTAKRIEVQIARRVQVGNMRGQSFLLQVLIVSRTTMPIRKKYAFGARNGRFFFEECMDQDTTSS